MYRKKIITQSIKFALIGGATASALALPFASAVTEEESVDPVERISVTGSRIVRANNISTSPVLAISAAEIKATGITRVEDFLNEMPQVVAAQNSTVANGSSGTATVDLRGLGEDRTLVLVNGRRLPAGTVNGSSAADLNNIPMNMIERVDVLTGGSSATYGADAVAGIVNFILKKDFEGFEFDYQYSFYQHDNDNTYMQNLVTSSGYDVESGNVTDGDTNNFSMRLGSSFDDGHGNVTMYAVYRKVDALLNGARDYSGCSLGGTASDKTCRGSGTSATGTFLQGDNAYTVEGTSFTGNTQTYNFGPLNYYQRPDENKLLGATGFYEINEHAEVYAEVSMMDDHTVAQIAPSGNFFNTDTINCDNPLLSTQQYDTVCSSPDENGDAELIIGRRNVEGGPRQNDIRHTTYRGVLGVRGEINDEWSYDAFANYGNVVYQNTYLNDMSNTRIARSLDVVTDTDGSVVCQSVVDGSDPDCVPWDIFSTGGVTQEAIDYLVLPLYATGETENVQISASAFGDMTNAGWVLPTATTGLGLALGMEFRDESLTYSPDSGYQSGDGAGQGGPSTATQGSYHVMDYFIEVNLPILEDKFLAEELVFEGAYRFSDYSTDNQTNTYKLGLNWKLNDQMRIRSSLQHAVRSPNLGELYDSQGLQLFDWDDDPCSGTTPTSSLADCTLTGVTSTQYGNILASPAGQYNQYGGGNPDLDPESSDTVSIGLVFTPDFIDNFSIAFDYFDISVDDAIDEISPVVIVEECIASGDATSDFCQQIQRNTDRGDLWIGSTSSSGYVRSLQVNTGNLSTRGVDTDINYLLETNMGDVRFNLVGTYLDSYKIQSFSGSETIECAGKWDRSTCEAPKPRWRHLATATWATPWDVNLTGRWRYIGDADEEGNSDDPMTFKAVNYFDLSGSWQALENLNFQLGVNNIFDESPQTMVVAPSGISNGNTFSGTYDALGRYIYLGGTVVF